MILPRQAQNHASLQECKRDASPQTFQRPPSKALALTGLCIGFAMVILDTNILNVALPAVQHDLGGSLDGLQWIVNSYTLVFASLLLSAGALGDRLGTKKVFVVGLLLFGLASFLCGLASSLPTLMAARLLQGIGAALLSPGSLSLITHTYPDPSERARAVGIWAGISGIGFAGGPVVGGLLVNSLGWHSVFWLNVPVSIVATLLTLHAVTAPRPICRRFDLAGQCLAVLALSALTFALTESGRYGWTHPVILALYLLVVVLIVLFVVLEQRMDEPMLPLSWLAHPSFSIGNLVGFFYNFGLYGMLFVLTLFFQQIRGYSAALTGLAFLPLTLIGAMTGPLISGRLTSRTGPRLPLLIGLTLCGSGALILMTVGTTTTYLLMAAGFALFGFGGGMTTPAMTVAVLSTVPAERSGVASAVLNAARQMGGVLGVALLGTLVNGGAFVSGMHLTLLIVALGFWLCCVCAAFTLKG